VALSASAKYEGIPIIWDYGKNEFQCKNFSAYLALKLIIGNSFVVGGSNSMVTGSFGGAAIAFLQKKGVELTDIQIEDNREPLIPRPGVLY